jgi:hypothetical protein
MNHLLYTLLLAVLVSAAPAMLGAQPLKDRLYRASYLFLCTAFGIVACSWAMYLVERL